MKSWLLLAAMGIVSTNSEPVFLDGEFRGWLFVVCKTLALVCAYISIRIAVEPDEGKGGGV